MLALLLARQGVPVTLLEGHADFSREFRGDGIVPSTLEVLDELNLLDRVFELPHTRHQTIAIRTASGSIPLVEFHRVRARHPYYVRLPQARLLELLSSVAREYPSFRIVMGARVEQLVEEGSVIAGVRYRDQTGWHTLRASLTVGADGRFSRVRDLARLPSTRSAYPIDFLWFRLPTSPTDLDSVGGVYIGNGGCAYLRNRGQQWEVGYWLPKGSYQRLRASGISELRLMVDRLLPWLADRTSQLQDWRQTSLLSVESRRVRRWYRPGLLLIGDAAHVMSPIGGVGINLAIQDAVVTANVAGPRLRAGTLRVSDLVAIQRRRELATRLTQVLQDLALHTILGSAPNPGVRALARLIQRVPALRDFRAHVFAFGGILPARVGTRPPRRFPTPQSPHPQALKQSPAASDYGLEYPAPDANLRDD
jgi:2-polyprenyl-6-methoxyphenol hydroxylase-like FAD-dependent oxidoreductase